MSGTDPNSVTDPKLVAEIDAIEDRIIDAGTEVEPVIALVAGGSGGGGAEPTGGPYKPTTDDPLVTPTGGPYKPTSDPAETNGGPYKPTTDEPAAATT